MTAATGRTIGVRHACGRMILRPAGAGPQVIIMLETLMALALTSSVFRHDGPIPRLHTAYDKDKKEAPPQ